MRRLRLSLLTLLGVWSIAVSVATAGADEPEPLTLSVGAARETCTLGSVTTLDYAIEGGVPPYRVTVDGRPIEDLTKPNHIPCRSSALWTRLGGPGDEGVQRIIVSVGDAAGARAFGVAEHELVRPLPPPSDLQASSDVTWSSEVSLTVRWWVPYLPREQRTEDFAIRWRVAGTSQWQVEHLRGDQGPVFAFQRSWNIDAPPTGERRELQVAQIRHLLDLQAPEALRWTPTALLTTAAHPHELQVEAAHDAITLSWGPHASGLAYVARLGAVGDMHRNGQERRLATGPLFEARF